MYWYAILPRVASFWKLCKISGISWHHFAMYIPQFLELLSVLGNHFTARPADHISKAFMIVKVFISIFRWHYSAQMMVFTMDNLGSKIKLGHSRSFLEYISKLCRLPDHISKAFTIIKVFRSIITQQNFDTNDGFTTNHLGSKFKLNRPTWILIENDSSIHCWIKSMDTVTLFCMAPRGKLTQYLIYRYRALYILP